MGRGRLEGERWKEKVGRRMLEGEGWMEWGIDIEVCNYCILYCMYIVYCKRTTRVRKKVEKVGERKGRNRKGRKRKSRGKEG